MRYLISIILFLSSCEKPELITTCQRVTNLTMKDNVATWNGTGPFIIERYDLMFILQQTDTVNVPTLRYEPFLKGYVRVRPMCDPKVWSQVKLLSDER